MAMVLVVILFESETWVMTPRLEKALKSFHHKTVRRMAGMAPKHRKDKIWVYPPIGAALEIMRLDEIGVYITQCYNMVAQYIATSPIMELCLAAEPNTGLQLSRRWWDQTALDILGIRAGNVAAEVQGDMRKEESEKEGEGK